MWFPVVEVTAGLVGREELEEKGAKKGHGPNTKAIIVVGIIAVAIFVILLITYLLTLKFRTKSSQSRRKSRKPWSVSNWLPWRRQQKYSASLQDNERELERNESHDTPTGVPPDPERQTLDNGVDRNTSVRSVMTLPAYSPAARENERILGREGERAGIDTVIEFPEAPDEEEQRREEEMESLYQIRLARREEARQREERRRLRREARQRGDVTTLAELRRQAEEAADLSASQILIAEHQTRDRERRVSSVQYGDLGVARHDGTRIRASSMESDHRPLLDSAASISGQSQRSRVASTNTLHTHFRIPSNSSALSISTRASDDYEFPRVHRNGSGTPGTGTEDFEVVSLSHARSRSASRDPSRDPSPFPVPVLTPGEEPPTYDLHATPGEEAPPYESPVNTRGPQLPAIERLPSIHITTEPTPVDGRIPEPSPNSR